MRAIQAQEFGGPEVLKPVELDSPEPAVGAAVVAVHAVDVLGLDTAVRYGDAAELFGIVTPYVPGDGAAAGRVRPVIGPIFPLEGMAEAHATFERGGLVGRTLITVAEVEAMAGHDELVGLVERFSQGFATADAELLTGLWADDEDNLVHVAGERAHPLRNRGEIARYYRETLSPVRNVDIAEVTDLSVETAGDRGRAFFRFRFAGREAASDDHFDVEIRITAIARRRDDRWVLVHYHEPSPGHV